MEGIKYLIEHKAEIFNITPPQTKNGKQAAKINVSESLLNDLKGKKADTKLRMRKFEVE